MKFYTSNDIGNILFGLSMAFLIRFQQSYCLCLATEKLFWFNILGTNKWIRAKIYQNILTIFLFGIITWHFSTELLSLLNDEECFFVQYHEWQLTDLDKTSYIN